MAKLTPKYNLKVLFPKVAKEWHPTKNKPLTPDKVLPGSHSRVWWKCKKNKQHVWETEIRYRVGNNNKKGSNCPKCFNAKRRMKG